jgi:hypothetical protein
MGRETDRPNLLRPVLQPTWPKGLSMAFSKGSLKDARSIWSGGARLAIEVAEEEL